MLQPPDDQSTSPTPQEESSEPKDAFVGDVKVSKSEEGGGVGEFVGRQYLKSLEKSTQAEESSVRKRAKGYVRESLELGSQRKQEAEAKREVQRLERSQQSTKPTASDSWKEKKEERQAKKETQAAQRLKRTLSERFNRAKLELSNRIRAEQRKINALKRDETNLERQLETLERSATKTERATHEAGRELQKLERQLDKMQQQERALTSSGARRSMQDNIQLRQVRNAMNTVRFTIRKLEQQEKAAGRSLSGDELKERQLKSQIAAVQKSIANLEEQQSVYHSLLRDWQAKHNEPNVVRAWDQFESKLVQAGIKLS